MCEDGVTRMESAVYALAWEVLAQGRDCHILEIEDRLAGTAKRLGCDVPDRPLLRRFFWRVLFGLCWQRLEAVYGFYAEQCAFEQRLDAWVEAMGNLARPYRIIEILAAHCRENPRLPLIHDVISRLGSRDLLHEPGEAEREKAEGSSPGFARAQFEQWLAKTRQAG